MSRYIDADALLKGYEDHELISTHLMWNAPTADVVEVVRCKDCKFWDSGCKWCDLWGDTQEYGDGYCSYGERKDDEHK